MTKLYAVNLILTKAGMMRVTALDTDGGSHATEAEKLLDEEELRIQSEGWYYNERYNVELTPDGTTGKIRLPDGAIVIDSVDSQHVTQLGAYLYDKVNNTDVFTETVKVEYSLRYNFPCIPEPVATFIAIRAAAAFAENRPRTFEMQGRLRTIYADLDRAEIRAKQFNEATEDTNVLNTRSGNRMRGGRDITGTNQDENYV